MNLLRINPQIVKNIPLYNTYFLFNKYQDMYSENEMTEEQQISIIECTSDDVTNEKNIILPQFEIGNFKVAEFFLVKMLSMKNLGASIIGEDEENIYVSLIELQEIANDSILDTCTKNGFVEAEIIKFVKFGAYLMIQISQEDDENALKCFKTYLLKNSDFSTDHTSISKVKKEGDNIQVKIYKKEENENSKLIVEAYEKYENPNKADINDFSNITMAIGYVSSINSTMTFVTLAEGIDALVNVTPNCQNIRPGSKVVISKLKLIEKDNNKKISGVVSNVIEY